jgi:hypothetical protein
MFRNREPRPSWRSTLPSSFACGANVGATHQASARPSTAGRANSGTSRALSAGPSAAWNSCRTGRSGGRDLPSSIHSGHARGAVSVLSRNTRAERPCSDSDGSEAGGRLVSGRAGSNDTHGRICRVGSWVAFRQQHRICGRAYRRRAGKQKESSPCYGGSFIIPTDLHHTGWRWGNGYPRAELGWTTRLSCQTSWRMPVRRER